jgi:hypothetical protein
MPRIKGKQDCQDWNREGQIPTRNSPDCQVAHPIHDEKEQAGENDLGQERHAPMMALNSENGKPVALDQELARHGALLMRERYGQGKGVHAWAPYMAGKSRTFQPGDFLAINVTELICPRQLVAVKLRTQNSEARGIIAVYLGLCIDGIHGDAIALCDPQPFEPTPDRLNTWTIPLADLSYVIGIVGVASLAKPYRKLGPHKFKGWERRAVESWEEHLLAVPLPAMRGDFFMEILPATVGSNGSIH